jgi:hypothetical protein
MSLISLVSEKPANTEPKTETYVGMKLKNEHAEELAKLAGCDVSVGGTNIFKAVLSDYLKLKGVIE